MAEHQVLFCPFCRESFEGLRLCPDHDLPLVPFHKLPRDRSATSEGESIDDEQLLDVLEPRYGRAYVALGAVLNALGLGLEFVRFPDGSGLTTLVLASSLPALWTLALVSFTLLYVLRRGRTLRALRALRVLVPALAIVSPVTLLWELYRIRHGALLWVQHVRSAQVEPGGALYVVLVAAVLIFYGGMRLGVRPAQD